MHYRRPIKFGYEIYDTMLYSLIDVLLKVLYLLRSSGLLISLLMAYPMKNVMITLKKSINPCDMV